MNIPEWKAATASLGPKAGELLAAAQAGPASADEIQLDALKYLAATGTFAVPRPTRAPDKFGAEHDVFLAEDGLRVIKFGRNYGFVPGMADGQLIMKPATPLEYLLRHWRSRFSQPDSGSKGSQMMDIL